MFTTHEGRSSKYAYISKGKIVTKENGEKKSYDGIQGHVCAIDFELGQYNNKEYEKLLLFMVDSHGNENILTFPLESGYGSAFCKIAKNIDWSKPIEISAKFEEVTGKPNKTSLFVKQHDGKKWTNIKWAYTKENPGKMPEPAVGKDRNGEFWDYSKRNKFFRDLLIKMIAPAIKKAYPNYDATASKKKAAPKDAADVTEPIEDLPF